MQGTFEIESCRRRWCWKYFVREFYLFWKYDFFHLFEDKALSFCIVWKHEETRTSVRKVWFQSESRGSNFLESPFSRRSIFPPYFYFFCKLFRWLLGTCSLSLTSFAVLFRADSGKNYLWSRIWKLAWIFASINDMFSNVSVFFLHFEVNVLTYFKLTNKLCALFECNVPSSLHTCKLLPFFIDVIILRIGFLWIAKLSKYDSISYLAR